MKTIAEQTLATIVTNNHFTVPVFEKYNLDFCCKGKRTLAEACIEKGISLESISMELERSTGTEQKSQMPFTAMNAEQLISYILIHHHFYVKQAMPAILLHLEKVVAKHGDHYPYMTRVLHLFNEINEEMTGHMQKEELILFPRIKEVETLFTAKQSMNLPGEYVSGPIQVMESEHEQAGEHLYMIRELTNMYTAPEDACTTFKVVLAELKSFEDDLHQHVHLENNLLFPLAEKMMSAQYPVTTQCNLN
ncbi:MAG: iron-sulfur cluster repair di-iron protein [Ferruginibacter sp.]